MLAHTKHSDREYYHGFSAAPPKGDHVTLGKYHHYSLLVGLAFLTVLTNIVILAIYASDELDYRYSDSYSRGYDGNQHFKDAQRDNAAEGGLMVWIGEITLAANIFGMIFLLSYALLMSKWNSYRARVFLRFCYVMSWYGMLVTSVLGFVISCYHKDQWRSNGHDAVNVFMLIYMFLAFLIILVQDVLRGLLGIYV